MGMLSKKDAEKIATAVNAIRPDWSINGLMAVLGDPRCRNRATNDLTIAFIALAVDESSRKPTRIYEHGPWWEILRPLNTVPHIRAIEPTDCIVCSKPKHLHTVPAYADHEFRSMVDVARTKATA